MRKLTAVGAYIFAGGFTLGMSKYFRVLAHLEDGLHGVATTRLNFPRLPVYTEVRRWPLAELARLKPDVLYSNPPCAAWSAAGIRSAADHARERDRWRTDARVSCVHNCFEAFRQLQPDVWVWESVPRALTSGWEFVQGLTRECTERGYAVTYLVQEASLLGVPQRRRRFMFIAHKYEIPWTPGDPSNRVTVGQALRGVRPDIELKLGRKFRRVLVSMRDRVGGIRGFWDERHPVKTRATRKLRDGRRQFVGRPHFLSVRLDPDDVAPTMVGGANWFHWREHRHVSPRESAVLCGFPVSYRWSSPKPYAEIAQGVMPPVAAWLAKHLARSLRARAPASGVRRVDIAKVPGQVTVTDLPRPDRLPRTPRRLVKVIDKRRV